VASRGRSAVLGLALAMLGLQFSIGALNDYFDVDLDASPSRPSRSHQA
jgi:4-hydroxybenzoate polyprenyltransferase